MRVQKFIQAELPDNAINVFQNQRLSNENVVNNLLFQLLKPSNYNDDEIAAIRKYRKKKKKGLRL